MSFEKNSVEWFEDMLFKDKQGGILKLAAHMSDVMRENFDTQRTFILAYWKYLMRVAPEPVSREWNAWLKCYDNLTWMVGTQNFGVCPNEFQETLISVDKSVRKVLSK